MSPVKESVNQMRVLPDLWVIVKAWWSAAKVGQTVGPGVEWKQFI